MPRKSDKRERLIQSAKNLMFKQGFNLTTLADIAQEADVPLGNVYYYFKTKESIGDAVIAHCLVELNQRLTSYDALSTAKERLAAYLDHQLNEQEFIVKYGDRIGSLCQELAKQGGALASASAGLLEREIKWIIDQYQELGCDNTEAQIKAKLFIARIQGMNLISAVTNNATYITDLATWLRLELDLSIVSEQTIERDIEAYA